MTPIARAALIEYHVARARVKKAGEILCKELTLDELIHADLFITAVRKYADITGCSLAQAKATMEARRDVIVDRSFVNLYR